MSPLRRTRWDPQPTDPADVLLANDGRRGFSTRAVARAAALADSGTVAVVTVAKIYGTSLGLPHPGLLPTKQEMEERMGWVNQAISRLQRDDVEADGQVASTRRAVRTISRIARARKVRTVVLDDSPTTGLRRLMEGEIGGKLIRSLRGSGVTVEIVPFTGREAGPSGPRGSADRRKVPKARGA